MHRHTVHSALKINFVRYYRSCERLCPKRLKSTFFEILLSLRCRLFLGLLCRKKNCHKSLIIAYEGSSVTFLQFFRILQHCAAAYIRAAVNFAEVLAQPPPTHLQLLPPNLGLLGYPDDETTPPPSSYMYKVF